MTMAAYYCYVITTIISLYLFYLFLFKTYYKYSYQSDSEWHRIVAAPIVYILIFIFGFVPVLNIIVAIATTIRFLATPEKRKIDAWLFRVPEETTAKEEK